MARNRAVALDHARWFGTRAVKPRRRAVRWALGFSRIYGSGDRRYTRPSGMQLTGTRSGRNPALRRSGRPRIRRPIEGRVEVWLPFARDNRDLLRTAGLGVRPEYSRDRGLWTVSRTSLAAVVQMLLAEFGSAQVTTEGSTAQQCDLRCREAIGDDCVCRCAGSRHGRGNLEPDERVVGETTIVGSVVRWRRVLIVESNEE